VDYSILRAMSEPSFDDVYMPNIDAFGEDYEHVSEVIAHFENVRSHDRREEVAAVLCEELGRLMMIDENVLYHALLRAEEPP
jgi:succinate dehydrogenase/fumarate reductase flavoprotein subunit